MPILTLIIDLSPNFVANFSALAAHDAYCPPLNRKALIASHQNVWNKAKEAVQKMGLPQQPLRNWLYIFSELVRSGGNILLFGQEPSSMSHSWLLRLLRSVSELQEYTLRAVVCLGRPDVVLEQHCRLESSQTLTDDTIKKMTLNFSRLDTLVRMLLRELGDGNVTVIWEPTDSPMPGTRASQGLQEKLNLSNEVSLYPQHVLLLKSPQARNIWLSINNVRNTWPRYSEEQIFTTLLECEEKYGWSTAYVTSPEQRQAMLRSCEKSYAWISDTFFAGVPFFDEPCNVQEAWNSYEGLTDEHIAAFAATLPTGEREKLQRRLDIVHPLFDADQRHIAHTLKSTSCKKTYIDIPDHKKQCKLSVITLAYNQEKYISECIESVAVQQTSFKFKHIILDHASLDSTSGIINRYAEKYSHIVPVLMPTHLMKGENVRTLFSVADTPYVAVCDGDDYFTDPLKLQKQVDFLESHQECALCFHPVDVTYEDGRPSRVYPPEDLLPGGVRKFYSIKDLLFANIIQTNSVMYRWRFCGGLPSWFDCHLSPGDWYWHLLHAETGLIGYLRENMSVYRRHAASVYATAEGHHVAHRKEHGLNELNMYHVVNQHFKGRYYGDLRRLAIGVLADFLQIYMSTGDDKLLQTAAERFPDFTRDFLSEVKVIKHGATEKI